MISNQSVSAVASRAAPASGSRLSAGRVIGGVVLVCCLPAMAVAADGDAGPSPAPRTHLLVVSKPLVADPVEMQQRGIDAVRKVADAVGTSWPAALVDPLPEDVMTIGQFRSGQVAEKVTGAILRERLEALARTAAPHDTVIIYTHSHGRRDGFEETQPLGGIVVDLPVRRTAHGGTLLWDEYADLILGIPARNVIVLTMSCYAGGLVGHLESEPVRQRWRDRREREGRNLIILTSQNAELTSEPIVWSRELVNPFTLAVARAFAGDADGFRLVDGRAGPRGPEDGALTAGELVDFVLDTTATTVSERPRRPNTARPCVTGSYRRDDVLLQGGRWTGSRPGATGATVPNATPAR